MMKSRLKILQIIPSLHCGGAERFLVDLSNELAAEHDITVLCFNSITESDFLAKELHKSIKVESLNCPESFWGSCSAIPKMWNAIRQIKPDAVHLHLEAILAASAAILSWIPSVPYFYTVHNDAYLDAGKYMAIRKLLFKLGNVTPITISAESSASFRRAYKFSCPEIINGCREVSAVAVSDEVRNEMMSWRTSPDSRLLINLARVMPQKNQFALAKAVKTVNEAGYHLDMVIMGDLRDQQIVSQIHSLDCPQVHLVGRRKNPMPYLRAADALCLPSEMEGLPITLLEAFSLGKTACVTPVGGMKNLVHDNVNGLVAKGITADDIADMLCRFCQLTHSEIEILCNNAKKSFAPYSMKICAQNYLQLFYSVLASNRAKHI